MELAGGSAIVLVFVIVFLLAVIYGLFTRKGSGIAQHPHGKVYSGAPGAHLPSELSGSDRHSWTRGTR